MEEKLEKIIEEYRKTNEKTFNEILKKLSAKIFSNKRSRNNIRVKAFEIGNDSYYLHIEDTGPLGSVELWVDDKEKEAYLLVARAVKRGDEIDAINCAEPIEVALFMENLPTIMRRIQKAQKIQNK